MAMNVTIIEGTFVFPSVRSNKNSLSVFLIGFEVPFVTVILVYILTVAMLEAISILAFISRTVRPNGHAMTMPLAVLPLPLILTAICTEKNAVAVPFIFPPFTLVSSAAAPFVDTMTMVVTVLKFSLVSIVIWPLENAVTISQTVTHFAGINYFLPFVVIEITPSFHAMPN